MEERRVSRVADRRETVEHLASFSSQQNFLDTFSDDEMIDFYFSPLNGCTGERCDNEVMAALWEIAHSLATSIRNALPKRQEQVYALHKLQEAMFWTCAGQRRAHHISNVLQKKQGYRDLAKMKEKESK